MQGAIARARSGGVVAHLDRLGALEAIARREEVRKRAADIRLALGRPDALLLGVDRLDYTEGILHRLNAYGELLIGGQLGPQVVLVQVASPSGERVKACSALREEVERTVGRINGEHAEVGSPAGALPAPVLSQGR